MNSLLNRHRGGRRLRLAAALAAGVLLVGACGGDDDSDNPVAGSTDEEETSATTVAGEATSSEPQNEATVKMTDALRFDPPEIILRAGGTVTWTNPSTVVHTATGDPAKVADATHVELPAGAAPWNSEFVNGSQSFTQEFTVPGTYRYACIPHEGVGMLGTITVVP